jgi:predicted lipid-binding transport protein (Tim44 family)
MFGKSNDASRKRAQERHSEKHPEKQQPGKKTKKRREVKLFGGLAAGIIGGLVATWVLEKYQQGALEATRQAESAFDADPVLSRRQEDQLRTQQRAHAEAAERIAQSTFGKGLSRTQRRNAAPIVHYAIGALAGGAYGFAAEILPVVRRGYGTGFSNLLFLGGSQAMLPWLNLGTRQKVPSAVNANGLSAAFLYGAVLETTRRVLRWLL